MSITSSRHLAAVILQSIRARQQSYATVPAFDTALDHLATSAGVPDLPALLERERMHEPEALPTPKSLRVLVLLLQTWVSRTDQQALLLATGRNREQWLDLMQRVA